MHKYIFLPRIQLDRRSSEANASAEALKEEIYESLERYASSDVDGLPSILIHV